MAFSLQQLSFWVSFVYSWLLQKSAEETEPMSVDSKAWGENARLP